MTGIENLQRKYNFNPRILTLNKLTQAMRKCHAFYDWCEDSIETGCDELHTPVDIWHEVMHKIFFEQHCLECCVFWDNIADELQEYLFEVKADAMPYVYMLPAKKIETDKKWIEGKYKGTHSERTGWKGNGQARTYDDVHKNITKREKVNY